MDTTAPEDTSQDTTTPANVITEKPAEPATPTEPAVPTVPIEGEDGEVDLEEDKDDEPKPVSIESELIVLKYMCNMPCVYFIMF